MEKIKEFFKRFGYSTFQWIMLCALVGCCVSLACIGEWLGAACNFAWCFVWYINIQLESKIKRLRHIIDAQQGLIESYSGALVDALAECERRRKPVTRTTNISEAYDGIADTFSREELKAYLEKQGIKSHVRKVIYKWKEKSLIKEVAKNIYLKTNISAG